MTRPRSGGFALVELAAGLIVVALLAAVLAALASESRRQSSLGDNLANLKQFSSGTGAFAADNDDRVWTFSSTTTTGASTEAWNILRARTGLEAWLGVTPPSGWVPHVQYSHLVLLDYLGTPVPEKFAIAPEDHLRLLWASNPLGFEYLIPGQQRPPGTGAAVRRWPFSTSYELPPAFWSRDTRDAATGSTTVSQNTNPHYAYVVGSLPLGGRRLGEVALPSQKVMLFEQYQRHFGPRSPFFAYEEARVPIMFADGSAAIKRTGDAQRSFNPNTPTGPGDTRIYYTPGDWEPPTLNGQHQQLVSSYYRFTRSGLRGRDFGGPEVPWVD